MSGAPVIPVGMWGTERVWPRSARLPNMLNVTNPPLITIRMGSPVELKGEDVDQDTKLIMKAITELLPPEAHEKRTPTPEELAKTYPAGQGADCRRARTRTPPRHRLVAEQTTRSTIGRQWSRSGTTASGSLAASSARRSVNASCQLGTPFERGAFGVVERATLACEARGRPGAERRRGSRRRR